MESKTFLSRPNTEFALALLKNFSEIDNTENIFYSPFSISAALAMLMLGTGGNTATQMLKALCFLTDEPPQPEGDCQQMETNTQETQMQMQQSETQMVDTERVSAWFGPLLRELNKPEALSIVNGLYVEQTSKFKDEFLKKTMKYFDAQLNNVDFKTDAEGTRLKINDWVEKQTNEKIKNLLPSGSVDGLTKLVLVNAIYFKGDWRYKFKEEDTLAVEFRVNKNDTKPVKMMKQTSEFHLRSIEEMNCKVLELPYKGDDLSMIIILPNNIEDDTTGLENLERELTYQKFKDWTGRDEMKLKKVDVAMPRFKLEESYDLKEVLISMGMVDAFSASEGDFSGMSPAKRLTVSAVVHKAFVDVNEEGTEAAAATGVVVGTTSVQIPEKFNADHPFLFFIRHNPSKCVLFAGRFCSPE